MPDERSRRILVVEDNEADLQLLCDILRGEGFEVIGCRSAIEGLKCVEQETIAVIIDLSLPDLSSGQLAAKIRELDDVRMIVYTSAASYDSVKEALNLGAFAYVEKSSDPSELLYQVRRACRERIDRYTTDLEEAVARRTEELARRNRELEDFASVVAHDLRSPLLTISGYCEVFQDEYGSRLDENATEYLRHIIDGTTHMSRLIDDLLDYSRAGHSKEPFKPVDLEGVFVQVTTNLESMIRDSSARIDHAPLPRVSGNPTMLVRLFQNLISNAIKFRQQDTPAIRVDSTQEGAWWRLRVKDNGVGIPREHFEQVFDVFHRVHGQDYPGTGIGLAVCKKIVECHGGRIWVESEPGEGTSFFFTLPAQDPTN